MVEMKKKCIRALQESVKEKEEWREEIKQSVAETKDVFLEELQNIFGVGEYEKGKESQERMATGMEN